MIGEAECPVDEQQWPDINPLEWFQPAGEEAEQVGGRCKSQAKCLSTDRRFRSRALRKGLVMSTGGVDGQIGEVARHGARKGRVRIGVEIESVGVRSTEAS